MDDYDDDNNDDDDDVDCAVAPTQMMGYGPSRKLAHSPLHFIIMMTTMMMMMMRMMMRMMRKQLMMMMILILHQHPLNRGQCPPKKSW